MCLKFSSPLREANFSPKSEPVGSDVSSNMQQAFKRQNNPVSGLNQRLTCTIWLALSPPGRYLQLLASSRCMHRYPSRTVWTQMHLMTLLGKKKQQNKIKNTYLSIFRFKDGAYYCYCAYVLRISRYSDFLSPMLTNAGVFLRGLKLSGESRS